VSEVARNRRRCLVARLVVLTGVVLASIVLSIGTPSPAFAATPAYSYDVPARAGRNRVSVETPTGRLSVDLQGKAHFEKALGRLVDTPHTKFETRHTGPNGQVSYSSGPVRPATSADLRIIDRILGGRGY